MTAEATAAARSGALVRVVMTESALEVEAAATAAVGVVSMAMTSPSSWTKVP